MIIEPLTDSEIQASIIRSGWVLNAPESAKVFKRLATDLARAIERKNTRQFIEVGSE